MKNTRGTIALFITILIWGTAFMVTKLVLGVIGPLLLTEIRLALSFLLLLPFAMKQGFRLKDIFRREYMLFGLTGTTLYSSLENTGMSLTSVTSTALILAIIPALTTVLAVIFLKERIIKTQWLGLLLVTVGVMMIGMQNTTDSAAPRPLLGNVLVFLSALSWAVYTIQGRRNGPEAQCDGHGGGQHRRGHLAAAAVCHLGNHQPRTAPAHFDFLVGHPIPGDPGFRCNQLPVE